jgi:hypothetical protein
MEIRRPIELEQDSVLSYEPDKFLRYKFPGGGEACLCDREEMFETGQTQRVPIHTMWWISAWVKQQKKQSKWKDEGDGTQAKSDKAISLINIM